MGLSDVNGRNDVDWHKSVALVLLVALAAGLFGFVPEAWGADDGPPPIVLRTMPSDPNGMGGSWYFQDGGTFSSDFRAWEVNQQLYSRGLNAGSSVRAWSEYLKQPPSKMLEAMRLARDSARARGIDRRIDPPMGPDGEPLPVSGASRIGVAAGALAMCYASTALDKMFGEVRTVHGNGQECTLGGLFCGQEHYQIRGKGWFADEKWPDELAYLMPGYSYETTIAGDYTFPKNYPVTPQGIFTPQWFAQPFASPPHPTSSSYGLASYISKPWSTVMDQRARDVLALIGNPNSPIQAIFSGSNQAGDWSKPKLKDQVSGATYTSGEWFLVDADTSEIAAGKTPYKPYMCGIYDTVAEGEAKAQAMKAWIDTVLANPLIVPATQAHEQEGLDVPQADKRSLPAVAYLPGGVSLDDPVGEVLDEFDTPATAPGEVEAISGVPQSEDHRKATVEPALASLMNAAASRWPFAGFAVLSAMWNAPRVSSDPLVWWLSFTPFASTPQFGVPIEPLKWVEPFKPWRWFFVGGVAALLLAALFSILRPNVEV